MIPSRKIFQPRVYQSEISRNIFTGCSLQVFYSESKRLKDFQHINLSNNLYKTMWRRITAKKCSSELTIPNMVVGEGRVHISFHVDIENEILCYEPGMSALFLFFFRVGETSDSESQSLPWRFRGIQVNFY